MKAWGLIAFLFFAMSNPAIACTLQASGLPETIQKQLELECEKAMDEMSVVEETKKAEQLSAYAEVAVQVARALGVAAQELGVAVNDFLKSPAGLLTAGVIIFKVFGPLIFGGIAALFINLIGYKVLKSMWYRHLPDEVEVVGLFNTTKMVPQYRRIHYNEAADSMVQLSFFILVVCTASWIALPFLAR